MGKEYTYFVDTHRYSPDRLDYDYLPMRPVVVFDGTTKVNNSNDIKDLSVKELMMLDLLNEQAYKVNLNVWENDFGYYEKDENELYWTSYNDKKTTLLSNEDLANWVIEKYKLKADGPVRKINFEKLEELFQIYKSNEEKFYIYDDVNEENIYYFKDDNQMWCWQESSGGIGNCGGSDLSNIFGYDMDRYLSILIYTWNIIND